MENEVRDTIYLGVSLMMLAVVILFLTTVNTYRIRLAEARNQDTLTQQSLAELNEFGRYDGGKTEESLMTGSEVIALMMNYYTNNDIEVAVNKNKYGVYSSTDEISNIEEIEKLINDNDLYYPLAVYGDNMKEAATFYTSNPYKPETKKFDLITGILLIKKV